MYLTWHVQIRSGEKQIFRSLLQARSTCCQRIELDLLFSPKIIQRYLTVVTKVVTLYAVGRVLNKRTTLYICTTYAQAKLGKDPKGHKLPPAIGGFKALRAQSLYYKAEEQKARDACKTLLLYSQRTHVTRVFVHTLLEC